MPNPASTTRLPRTGATALAFGLLAALAATSALHAQPRAEPRTEPRAEAATPPAGALACTVVLAADSGRRLHRQGACDQRFSPMSSFKLPLALMGYDAEILVDASTPRWDYRPEYAAVERDRKAVDPATWERESVVWYSQELARRLGAERFGRYVREFGYGNADVRGNPAKGDGLTQSWLMSSLVISADEQVRFLRALLKRELPVSAHAYAMTAAILPSFPAAGGWVVQGKTGSGWLRDAKGGIDRQRPLGWFVGWAEKGGDRVVFARLEVGDRPLDQPGGFKARAAILEGIAGFAGSGR